MMRAAELACCRPLLRRRLGPRQALGLLLVLGLVGLYYTFGGQVIIIVILGTGVPQGPERPRMRTELVGRSFCPATGPPPEEASDDLIHWGDGQVRVLLFAAAGSPAASRELRELLGAVRVKYKQTRSGRHLPDMIRLSRGQGKFLAVVFQDMRDYYLMDRWNRDLLDKYCRQFKVGVLGFLPAREEGWRNETIADLATNASTPFTVTSGQTVASARTGSHPLLRILRRNVTVAGRPWSRARVTIGHLGPGLEPLVTTVPGGGGPEEALAVLEPGGGAGVTRVVVGGSSKEALRHWYMRLLLLDSLHHLSQGQVSLPLTRYLLVDIDDIFVGTARLLTSDVTALLESQDRLGRIVKDFRYNLGFSGKTFLQGEPAEDAGDRKLVAERNRFWWFPHMWRHLQPHRFSNTTELAHRMGLNKQFAAEKRLPLSNDYAVAPHHSGVYPVHEQLYVAWREVWDVAVTSTEEYPGLRPARRRRGFTHQGIAVLPRQTCGLYTKNTQYDDYPGGPDKLEASIAGGELFMSLVTNPISIFMSHMPNYCCDRLAPYTFESVASFVQCHTNLRLRTVPPRDLATAYFRLFPEERQAVWGNPCEDKRHLEIWSEEKTCDRLPQFLVVGPQKTGTTALSTFLQLHPSVVTSYPSKETFEEVQFFRGPNYARGLDWYMDFFPRGNDSVFMFEKSATYFDGEEAPGRAHRLLPGASVVAVLVPPGDRAYSWYQHQRAHADPAATGYTWREVLAAGPAASRPLLALQAHCLQPGNYAAHLERWLAHYRPKQLQVVDGLQLRRDPVTVMNQLQHFLQITPFFDYKHSLVYDKRKGFYCPLVGGKKKCLGKGKGRSYPAMDPESREWLRNYYKKANENLEKLLTRFVWRLSKDQI
jgi:heparan sulfate N-deacetylase/N-sulfotransferase NDST2